MSNPINHPMLPSKLMATATNIYYICHKSIFYVIEIYTMSYKYMLCHSNK